MRNKARNRSKKWPEVDLKWLRANYRKFTYKEIANKLGRTELAIKGIVIIEGWAKPKPKWQVDQVDMLRKAWGEIPIEELSKRIGKSKNSLLCKAHRLKLRKRLTNNQ